MSRDSQARKLLDSAGYTVSITEAAKVLGVSRGTGYQMAHRGEFADLGIKVLRLGSRLRISTESLRQAVDADRHNVA